MSAANVMTKGNDQNDYLIITIKNIIKLLLQKYVYNRF